MKGPMNQGTADQRVAYYWGRVREQGQKKKDFDWPSTEVVLNLAYTYDVLMLHWSKLLSRYHLSLSAMNILTILKYSQGEGHEQQELCQLLLVSRANITKLIDSLVKRGLVIRTASQSDRRVWIVKLTSAGDKLFADFNPFLLKEAKRITSRLTGQEKRLLNGLFLKLRVGVSEEGSLR